MNAPCAGGRVGEANFHRIGLVGNRDDTQAITPIGDVGIITNGVNVTYQASHVEEASFYRVLLVGN